MSRMPPPGTQSLASQLRLEVAEHLRQKVIVALSAVQSAPRGTFWCRGLGFHRSGARGNKKRYHGWNAWLTALIAEKQGYESLLWYTQAAGEQKGWTLKPNAVCARLIAPRNVSDERRRREASQWVDFFRSIEVYNRDSFDGPSPEVPEPPWTGARGVTRVVEVLRSAGIDMSPGPQACFIHESDRIDMSPRQQVLFGHECDRIEMPLPSDCGGLESWAATLLHEIVHWTGGHRRLRRIKPPWTPPEYAFEELVAELGSAMLSAQLGIRTSRSQQDGHTQYLCSWADNVNLIIDAMMLSEVACAFVEDLTPTAFSLSDDTIQETPEWSVPRTLNDGKCWRQPVALEPPVGASSVHLGPAIGATLDRWANAYHRWELAPQAPPPVLVLVGRPGDGAETILHTTSKLFPALQVMSVSSESELRNRVVTADLPIGAVLRRPPTSTEFSDARAHIGRVDLEPIPRALASAYLRKGGKRPWLAVVHGRRSAVRQAESWANRLRTIWLDGPQPAGSAQKNQPTFFEFAPFSPVVLWAAQAVLDGIARQGRDVVGLQDLVVQALANHAGPSAWDLVPLDILLAPVFGFPVPASGSWPELGLRMKAVIQVLSLAEEVSRGTKTVMLMLQRTMDEDVEVLEEAAIRTYQEQRDHEPDLLGIRRRHNSWSCIYALTLGGKPLRFEANPPR